MKRVVSILSLVLFVSLFVTPSFAAEKEWTIMVFLNADNNLDSFGVTDQQEMSKVGSNEWLNIVSLIDRENGPATLNLIEKNKVTPLKEMGELDMGDYKQLVSFVKDMTVQFPAKKYALIVWNHGSGWKNVDSTIIKGISYDDSTGNHITTAQLTTAMNEIKSHLGRNLDIFSMDACLMQMLEVAYAVRSGADYMVASEETEPGDGYPYDKILEKLTPSMTPAAFTKEMVAAYDASYNGGSQGNSPSTQSCIDLSKIDGLCDALNGFAKTCISSSFAPKFKDALVKVQKFYYKTNIDLGHLVKLLKGTISDEAFLNAAGKLEAALTASIHANGSNGSTMANASGLAIYFPSASYGFDKTYNDLAFAQENLWDEMVQDYYVKLTAPAIIADVEGGNVESLIEYARTANENNREVTNALIAQLNFRVFAEGGCGVSVQDNVKSIIRELKDK
ncbi:MAG: hypothetical protein HQM10_11375 [Candidatus Riflebacteria bacterium]|nr:hypothetical protein [Candidatus Riflebacteria bacterium]